MKKNFKLFCFGFGQVAKYFVKNLIKNNYKFDLVTTNTVNTKFKKIGNLKYKSYYFNNNSFDVNLLKNLNNSNKVLISIPPKDKNDLVLKKFANSFKNNKFDWITYLSATSVYGDKKGRWANEKSKTYPTSARGVARLNAENKWLKYSKNFNLPVQIFRLSGIYSDENNVIKRLKKNTVKLIEKKNQYFSRIHIEDIAKILTLSLNNFKSGQVFNISDDYPSTNYEIIKYATNLINIDMPPKIKLVNHTNSIIKDFYKDSKKISNKKMKIFFKYELKYPTFKEGLRNIRDNIV